MAWALEAEAAGLVIVSGVTLPWPGKVDLSYRVLGSSLGGAVLAPLGAAFVPRRYVDTVLDTAFRPQLAPRDYLTRAGVPLAIRTNTLRANNRQVNTLRPHVVERRAEERPGLARPVGHDPARPGRPAEGPGVAVHRADQGGGQVGRNAELDVQRGQRGLGHTDAAPDPDDHAGERRAHDGVLIPFSRTCHCALGRGHAAAVVAKARQQAGRAAPVDRAVPVHHHRRCSRPGAGRPAAGRSCG